MTELLKIITDYHNNIILLCLSSEVDAKQRLKIILNGLEYHVYNR